MAGQFENKVVMITGAPGNVGSAVVERFAQEGAKLALVDLRAASCEKLAQDIKDQMGDYVALGADVTDPESVKQLIADTEAQLGPIDILAHTVGGFAMGDPVHAGKMDVWNKMMALNATSVYVTCGSVAAHMLERGVSGKIVAILAKTALQGNAKQGPYAASKAAAQRVIQAMAAELKDQGINVNGIMPSLVDTPPNRQDMPNADTSKWVTPQNIADAVAFLASDAASAMHGASLELYNRV